MCQFVAPAIVWRQLSGHRQLVQVALWTKGVAMYVKSTKTTDSQQMALAEAFMSIEYHSSISGVNW